LPVPRDSYFGERIIWQGRPEVVKPPAFFKALAAVAFVSAAISLSFAAVIAFALAEAPLSPLLFFAWCVTLGVLLLVLPRRWAERARYTVTESHVIVKYGPFSRTIERHAISFARIFWNEDHPNTGDLEIVRAVPTGALKRRLRLRLSGLLSPDRVWAIVRGAADLAPTGHGPVRPVGQRLDEGERVMWTARSRFKFRAFLPQAQREWLLLAIALFLTAGVVRMTSRLIPTFERLGAGAMPMKSFSFVALSFGVSLALLLMLAMAGYLAYDACIRQGLLAMETRYLVTNKRVLIQRRGEELHLDREKIIDVIDAPAGAGLRDIFIVLDGPRARAAATSGAFGEMARGPHLRPVFEAVEDAESVSRILRQKQRAAA
jgi:hypothetical protein